MASFLRLLAADTEFEFEVHEVDIQNSPTWDLADESLQARLLQELADGYYGVVLITPPCSTWSRVRGANCRGPPMIRSRQYPWGSPWLSKRHRKDADLGNTLIKFTLQVLTVLREHPFSQQGHRVLVFGERPEDLGVIWREEDQTQMDPASTWQLPELRALVTSCPLRLFTVVFHQCCWGAPYRKPTRLITNLSHLQSWGPTEWPIFATDGAYAGPTIANCTCQPTVTLARQKGDTSFRTTATSIYPEAMDRAIAKAILADLMQPPPSAEEGGGRRGLLRLRERRRRRWRVETLQHLDRGLIDFLVGTLQHQGSSRRAVQSCARQHCATKQH